MNDENNMFSRSALIFGDDGLEKLGRSHVAVFGIGGVGSYSAEALTRGGIGELTLVDGDISEITNLNRQLYALHSTLGKPKTETAAQRIADINPECVVHPMQLFYTGTEIDLSRFDYIIDAIDTVSSKLTLIENAARLNIPIISCMGMGNRLDITKLAVSDIYGTSVCPLARIMRYELKKRGVMRLNTVYSTEQPAAHVRASDEKTAKRVTIGSVSFVPPAAGLLLAGEVIKMLVARNNLQK